MFVVVFGGCMFVAVCLSLRLWLCVCVTLCFQEFSNVSGLLHTAGGHPPPQWRMANEEVVGGAANVPAELLYKLFSFRLASHGGSHAIPLNLPLVCLLSIQ